MRKRWPDVREMLFTIEIDRGVEAMFICPIYNQDGQDATERAER